MQWNKAELYSSRHKPSDNVRSAQVILGIQAAILVRVSLSSPAAAKRCAIGAGLDCDTRTRKNSPAENDNTSPYVVRQIKCREGHLTQKSKERFGTLRSISMDKGFHSAANQTQLKEVVDVVVLPKKGKLSGVEQKRQAEPEFAQLRHQHSAVESAINALEQHGLDKCPPEFDSSKQKNPYISNGINRLAALFEIFVVARFKL